MNGLLRKQMSLLDEQESLWKVVSARDTSSDGDFVFAVTTTKIYCRPSCPARRPRKENVTFFSSPEDAESAGFRACRRCHPNKTRAIDSQIEMIKIACRLIDENQGENLSLEALSKQVGLSSFHFQRTFKDVLGITPREYAAASRNKRFREGVQSGESISAAMYDAGYGSSSRLYEHARSELGMTPATYSRSGRATKINYTVVESSLGYLLVAATNKGICSVRLGDSQGDLETDLENEFAAADIQEDAETLAPVVEQILKHLSGREPHLDLPLDIRSTAFQRLVWQSLREIPYGETRSYGEVAKAIGQPTAVRAVARACATNPVALAIPCHRVIREDKSLGGYRWGLERKKKLLANESYGARGTKK